MLAIVGSPDGRGYTLRRLVAAAEFKLKHENDGPAIIAATIANCHRGNRPPFTLYDFHPYRRGERRGLAVNRKTIKQAAAAIVGRPHPSQQT